MPLPRFISLLKTRPDRPKLSDEAEVRRRYRSMRWQTFIGITLGYSFFYTTRLSLSVAKQPLIDSGVAGADQLGLIGSALYFTYAFGRLTNGFFADRAHIGRFMFMGLMVSSLINLGFGSSGTIWIFTLLWGVNGWFQSMGSAPSGANMSHWFSNNERGTRYSIWSTAHSLGEGFTFLFTAALAQWQGWRSAFWGPGLVGVGVALLILRLVKDRPPTYGLPLIADFRQDHGQKRARADASIWELQRAVIGNVHVWVLGLSSACMYMSRYAINGWMMLFLQKSRGYSMMEAGGMMTLLSGANLAGSVAAGPTSDYLFGARRPPATLIYGLLLVGALTALHLTGAGHPWVDRAALLCCGFGIGGLLVFLGGLSAIDICPKRASGAAMGVIGLFSYLAAALQDVISGHLIEATKTLDAAGAASYVFDDAFRFWIGAAVASMLLAASLWRVKVAD